MRARVRSVQPKTDPRPNHEKIAQVVCISSTRVEGSCWCVIDFPLRRFDGDRTKTEQREYETEARERPGHLELSNVCAPGPPGYRASSRAK